jgi:CBS domain-containing protein
VFEDIGNFELSLDIDVWDVLHAKGKLVHSVEPFATVREAVADMNRCHVGSLLVMEHDELVGIINERDLLMRVLDEGRNPDDTLVSDVMTRNVNTISPDTPITEGLKAMSRTRNRHLPVVLNGVVMGVVSLGDLSRALTKALARQVDALTDEVESSAYLVRPGVKHTG